MTAHGRPTKWRGEGRCQSAGLDVACVHSQREAHMTSSQPAEEYRSREERGIHGINTARGGVPEPGGEGLT